MTLETRRSPFAVRPIGAHWRARLCVALMAAGVLTLVSFANSIGPANAGASERLMAVRWNARLSLFRGSDPGTVCYELIAPSPQPPENTYDVYGLVHMPPGPDVMGFAAGRGVVNTGCVGGLDEALITDLFAHPADYSLRITTHDMLNDDLCGGYGNCGESFTPLAPEGSACEIRANELTFASATVNEPLELHGWGFVPGTEVQLVFTPDVAPDAAGSIGISVDDFAQFAREFTPRDDQRGRWTVTAIGETGCEAVVDVLVYPPVAGSTFPPGATAFPMVAGQSLPQSSAADVLPDTSMSARSKGNRTALTIVA